MAALSPTTTFRRNPLFTLFSALEEECRFLSKLSPERLSLLRLSHLTQLKMWRQRSRTRKGSPQTNRGWSLLVNSWKMAELSLTTTFRRSPLSIWFFVLGEECRFLSRLLLERPSPLRLSHLIQLKMWRQRSRTRKGSLQISKGWSLLANSWKMAELSQTTTFRRNQLFILFSALEEECKFLSKLSLEKPLPLRLSHLTQLKM